MNDSRIGEQHRARKAMLYVRQSSLHQVEHHQVRIPEALEQLFRNDLNARSEST